MNTEFTGRRKQRRRKNAHIIQEGRTIVYTNARLEFTKRASSAGYRLPDGEITSLEWNIIGMLEVSYAVGKSGQSIKVDCTVFNEDKKPVGGGFSYTSGGVAQMSIKVPSKLQNTNSVTVTCVPTR